MDELKLLNNAFSSFTEASKRLELYYEQLQQRINNLTLELEKTNLQLREALKETERAKDYLNCILQSIGEAIVVVDIEGNIRMINKTAEEILGMKYEDVINKPFYSLNIKIKRDGPDTILFVNGKSYNVLLTLSDIIDSTSEGILRGHVILFKDVTRLKELEASYERNKRLIAMGEMAAKIVHEIRSPLCSIELYAGMLKSELEETKHINLARGISNGIKSLNNILTNMLFFARPQKPILNDLSIKEVIDETLNILLPMIENRNLKVYCEIPFDCIISGDKELLKQVLLNIVLNAISVSSEGKNIYINANKEGEFVVVEIRDEGEGIKEEDRERIFDPFFTTKEKGTGLGLTIASKIMQSHNGFIKVKSELGKGSSFQLYFPLFKKNTNNTGKELFFYEANTCC